MDILHILSVIFALFSAPFIKLWRATALVYVVLVANADLALLHNALEDLLDVNMAQTAYINYLEDKCRDGEQQRVRILNYGWSGVISLLEWVAVIEVNARNIQIELMDDLGKKEEELQAVRKALAAAQARIAALEDASFQHISHISTLATSHLAVLDVNRAQDEYIKQLQSHIVDLQDAAVARQEEQEVEAHRNAERMKMKTTQIKVLTRQLNTTRRAHSAHRQAHRQIITVQAQKITELEKVGVVIQAQLVAVDKNSSKLRNKLAGAIAAKREQEKDVLALRAEIKAMKERAAEDATTQVVRQLATTEQLGAMENRAKEAEERVAVLEREAAENSVKVHQTICRLALVHAKQLTDIEATKMQVDAPAPAAVIGKRRCESLDFSVRYDGYRARKTGGCGRRVDGRPAKRVRG